MAGEEEEQSRVAGADLLRPPKMSWAAQLMGGLHAEEWGFGLKGLRRL